MLLCSDGLNEAVDDQAIAEIMNRAGDSASTCRELVDHALKGGAPDNVTVIAARYFKGR